MGKMRSNNQRASSNPTAKQRAQLDNLTNSRCETTSPSALTQLLGRGISDCCTADALIYISQRATMQRRVRRQRYDGVAVDVMLRMLATRRVGSDANVDANVMGNPTRGEPNLRSTQRLGQLVYRNIAEQTSIQHLARPGTSKLSQATKGTRKFLLGILLPPKSFVNKLIPFSDTSGLPFTLSEAEPVVGIDTFPFDNLVRREIDSRAVDVNAAQRRRQTFDTVLRTSNASVYEIKSTQYSTDVVNLDALRANGNQLRERREYHNSQPDAYNDISTGVDARCTTMQSKASIVRSTVASHPHSLTSSCDAAYAATHHADGAECEAYVDKKGYITQRQRHKLSLMRSNGATKPFDVFREKHIWCQLGLFNRIQGIYKVQGISIDNKHLEVILRGMTEQVLLLQSTDFGFLAGDYISFYWLQLIGVYSLERLFFTPFILGLTKVASRKHSFLASSSFQETKSTLVKHAFSQNIDFVKGLKEHVILAKFLPLGAGFQDFSLGPEYLDTEITKKYPSFHSAMLDGGSAMRAGKMQDGKQNPTRNIDAREFYSKV
jgi:hypothetical protein